MDNSSTKSLKELFDTEQTGSYREKEHPSVPQILVSTTRAIEKCHLRRSSRASRSINPIWTRAQFGRVAETATLRLQAYISTFWRRMVFYILNINQIRSKGSGNLHYHGVWICMYRPNKRKGQTILYSHSFLESKPLEQLCITHVERCRISNESINVFEEKYSQSTKGLVDGSISSCKIFFVLFYSFVGL